MKKIIVLLLLAAGVGVGGWYWYHADNHGTTFRTVQVERGDLLTTINATGTLEPEEVIDVGAQIAGQILSFGSDPRGNGKVIDYSSPVEKSTVLARIDESLYQAQVDRAKAGVQQAQAGIESANAQVAVAEANVKRAEADLGQMKAKLVQSERDWERAKRLGPSRALADVDVDSAEAAYRTNKATLAVGDATVVQTKASLKDAQASVLKAKASLADAEASLKNAEINLGYCTIKSPVKGVIIDRRVTIGQTVVSQLNAPSLFLIAKDLKRIQVWAAVNEADIGNIHEGQEATFTVDAYPGETFKGVVYQIRLNASMTQNVVTYTVVVNTDNSGGKLLPASLLQQQANRKAGEDTALHKGDLMPYMTANLQFRISKHTQVLLVPNIALRWKPNPQLVVPEARGDFVSSQRRGKAAPGEAAPAEKDKEKDGHHRGVLWVEDGGFVKPIKVQTGLSDGLNTEIVGGDIPEGAAVVIGESRAGEGGGGVSNPFAPKMFGGKKQ